MSTSDVCPQSSLAEDKARCSYDNSAVSDTNRGNVIGQSRCPRNCAVCGRRAIKRHFRALSCNACAAFFRRTVARRKLHICRYDKNCPIRGTPERRICRYCRFQLCIRMGMVVSAVQSPLAFAPEAYNEDNFLNRLVAARQATYVGRNQAIVHVYGGPERVVQTANKYRVGKYIMYNICAELIVVYEFIQQCQLPVSFIPKVPTTACHDEAENGACASFFKSWLLCESLLMTARNSGHRTNRYFFVDESYMTTCYDEVLHYYANNPNIRYPDIMARHSISFFEEALTLARHFHEAHMDDTECAALLFIFIANSVKEINSFRPQVEEVLRQLKRHYERNYDNVAVRMGGLILLLSEFRRLRHRFDEHITMMLLCGNRPAHDQLRALRNNVISSWTPAQRAK